MIIAIICESVAIVLLFIIAMIYRSKLKKINSITKTSDVKVIDNERYTKDAKEVNLDGSINISHIQKDIVLEKNVVYNVSKDSKIIPGKYTLLSTCEDVNSFNIRVDGFVREYKHQSSIVLVDGTTICAVSHSVILR